MSIDYVESAPQTLSAKELCVSLLDPVDAKFRRVVAADLEIRVGKTLAIVGASGGGKSTLAMSVAGLLPPSARVSTRELGIAGQTVCPCDRPSLISGRQLRGSVKKLRTGAVHYVSQHARSALIPNRSVRWHLAQSEKIRKQSQANLGGSVDGAMPAGIDGRQLLKEFCLGDTVRAESLLGKLPHQLSTGECQRVSFAMAYLLNPRLLVADEPFASLDPETREVLSHRLRMYLADGGSLMLVTHQLELLNRLADSGSCIVLDRGVVVDELSLPVFLKGGPVTRHAHRLIEFAHRHYCDDRDTVAPRGEPVLSVDHLAKRHGEARIFSDESFSVPRGSRFGVQGPSGGGKTTLARILVGLVAADNGTVLWHGARKSPSGLSRNALRQFWRQVQLSYQDADLIFDPNEAVGESLVRAARQDNQGVSRRMAVRAASETFAAFGLSSRLLAAPPSRLSGGERKRAGISRALMLLGCFDSDSSPTQDFRTLILDEPTVGLDVFHQGRLAETLISIQRESNLTVIVLSHDRAFLDRFCDDVIDWPQRRYNARLETFPEATTEHAAMGSKK